MILLNDSEVGRLIDPDLAIASARAAFVAHAAGAQAGRIDLRSAVPHGGGLVLAGVSDGAISVKTNLHAFDDAGLRSADSLLVLWDLAACAPRALLGTRGFNDHRTAAGFAAAVSLLAPQAVESLAIFGAGKIAPWALRYCARVRPPRRILVVGGGSDRAAVLCARARDWPECEGARIELADAREAAQADVIVTITTASAPIFSGAHVRPGAVVILGGANRPDAREADDALVSGARIFTDDQAICESRAGDLAIPLASGALPRANLAGMLGSLAAPSHDPTRPTIFKSMGIALQDLLLARAIVTRAEQETVGTVWSHRP